jgi:hypothetical protein
MERKYNEQKKKAKRQAMVNNTLRYTNPTTDGCDLMWSGGVRHVNK